MAGSSYNTAPAKAARPVTPHDTNVLTGGVCRSLYVGGAGAIAVRMADGGSATFAAVPVGILPIQCDIVLSTGTTATGIIALY
jgi:hypothetical protein